jgi:nucleoside-diphosphate-sugar epimerase
MRSLLTGGSGVLGRALTPLLQEAGFEVLAPGHAELDLFDADTVREALTNVDVVYHLATRIPSRETQALPGAWDQNDRLRAGATRVLVDAALATNVATFVLPSITFIYPSEGMADEKTPLAPAAALGSMIEAEQQCQRFGATGRKALILRLGLLWGPGTASDTPDDRFGATLQIDDAGRALFAALSAPAGIYNVVGNGSRIVNQKFKAATGWRPQH